MYLQFRRQNSKVHKNAEIILHNLLVKYYNNLLGRQSSEWGWDEVTFFYVFLALQIVFASFKQL